MAAMHSFLNANAFHLDTKLSPHCKSLVFNDYSTIRSSSNFPETNLPPYNYSLQHHGSCQSSKMQLRRNSSNMSFTSGIYFFMSTATRLSGLCSTSNFITRRPFNSANWQCGAGSGFSPESEADRDDYEIDEALGLDSEIPETSTGFLEKVSSRAYEMRSQLEQSMTTGSYDVLEANPFRDDEKPVYVLARQGNELYTMRTRRPRSEVDNELNLIFSSNRGSRRGVDGLPKASSRIKAQKQPSSTDLSSKFGSLDMHVEEIREGVLMFEDEEEAANYCSVLEGEGLDCMGIAEVEAEEIFSMCQKSRALAVLFRRGITPPEPSRLQMNLKARKHSLED